MKAKVITTCLDEKVTLDGSEWFVTMTDKFMSGWGCADGKIAKRIIICQTHADAETLRDRIAGNKRTQMTRVNVTPRLPYYTPSRYTTTYEKDDGNLFRY